MNTLRAALAKDAAETNFGNMAQAVDSTRADHIHDATKMMATLNEKETVEPVAYVTGYRDGFCVINPVEHVVFPTGMALYMSPPKREPLTDEDVERLIYENTKINPNVADDRELLNYIVNAVRAIERAHGIGGEE